MGRAESMRSAFESMRSKWRSIGDLTAGESEIAPPIVPSDRIKDWDQTFEAVVKERQELIQSGQWLLGPADLLEIIGQARRETFHCAILCWLMDPDMPHGLGDNFIRRVLDRIDPDLAARSDLFRGATFNCEVSRKRSRADLVVMADLFTLVIEAKVDAIERPSQCDDLFLDYCDERDPHFVFLTPRGIKAQTASGEAAEAFRSMSFESLWHDLRDVVKMNRINFDSALGRSSVESYLRTLERQFG